MNNQPQEPAEFKETDVKAELKKAKISLHNLKIQLQIAEAIVKKLEELVR